MLGYISSTRKKSCRQCVKAKRRCDLGFPCCKRCSIKALDCAYPNAEANHKAEVVIKATPNLSLPTTTAAPTIESTAGPVCLDFGAPMEPIGSGLDFTSKDWDGWIPEMGLGMAASVGACQTAGMEAAMDPTILLPSSGSDGSVSPPPANTNDVWSALDALENWEDADRFSSDPFRQDLQLYSGDSSSNSDGSSSSRSPSPPSSGGPGRTLLPEIWAPSYLNPFQVRYVSSALRSFIPALAKNGHNSFIHAKLYEIEQPSAYQDAVALASLHATKTKNTLPILRKTINSKIAGLIATSHTWTLEEHLAAVQAMIVYQTMRLFDPAMKQQAEAAPHNDLLALWAAHLWKRSFTSPVTLPACHSAWIFYESLRRTVLLSVVLRGGWHCATHDGICNQVAVLARLPLSTDEALWTESEDDFTTRTPCYKKREALVSYGDWAQDWKPGRDDPTRLSDFQRMLLIACRGKEDPRLFFKEPSFVE